MGEYSIAMLVYQRVGAGPGGWFPAESNRWFKSEKNRQAERPGLCDRLAMKLEWQVRAWQGLKVENREGEELFQHSHLGDGFKKKIIFTPKIGHMESNLTIIFF